MRIVSLIASATEIVHALGLGRFQVGRSHECDYPAAVSGLPVCTRPKFAVDGSSGEIDRLVRATLAEAGSVYEVFDDVLAGLAPTHIVTQSHCRVCAVSREDVERALGDRFPSNPAVVSLEPNSLADVWGDIRKVASAFDAVRAGERLIARMQERMAAGGTTGEKRPRVACIEWMDPLMPAGNWVPELVELAGGENLFTRAGEHSPYMTWDSLRSADPDVILVMPCGFDIAATRRDIRSLTGREGWRELTAVRQGQVYLVDGNAYFNRPGPRLADSVEILGRIFSLWADWDEEKESAFDTAAFHRLSS
ncbi:MAG: cobalamin-binding protein [Bryobacteraceae bacterium]